MIETAMLFALGFFSATVLALLFLPVVSRRAARLAQRRVEMQLPLSMSEISAERDGIRAVAAVEQRRLEQRIEAAHAASAAAAADLGRRTAELTAAERAREADAVERQALADRLHEAKEAGAEAEARWAVLDLSLREMQTRLKASEAEAAALTLRRDELDRLAEEGRVTIAGLETRNAGLEMRLGDLNAERERDRIEQEQLRASISDLTRARDLARNEILLATTHNTMLQDDYKDLTRRFDDSRARLQARTEALADVERRLMEDAVDRRAAESALAALRLRFQALEARLIDVGAGEMVVDAELASLRTSIGDLADDTLRTLQDPAPKAPTVESGGKKRAAASRSSRSARRR